MAKAEVFQEVEVRLPTDSYSIRIGRHLLTDAVHLKTAILSNQVLIVTNETLALLYLNTVHDALRDFQCDIVILPDGEAYKTQASITKIHEALIQYKHHRDTTLIALGGGVVGDITGFAASTYHRGVACIQIPTTLLAQVDAAVGGKTAINYPNVKNVVGTFHQPSAVFIDLNTLDTLPEREFRAGMAEVIKYGLLVGGEFWEQLKLFPTSRGLSARSSWDVGIMPALIANCCRIKADFIQQDERETTGARVLLNLGHTFAHALEAATNYERWLHGEAVAIGLYCAAQLSHHLGYLSQADLTQLDALLENADLPRRIPQDISLSKIYDLMHQDKKVLQNKLRFILIKAPGDCYVDTNVCEQDVLRALADAVSFT